VGLFKRKTVEATSVDVAKGCLKNGSAAYAEGRFDDSQRLFREAVDTAAKAGQTSDGIRCSAMSSLATIHTTRGEFAVAEQLLDQATEIVIRNRWNGNIRHIGVLTNRAVLCWHAGRRRESLDILKFAYEEFAPRAKSDADHKTLAGLMKNIVRYYVESGDIEAADEWSRATLVHCENRGNQLPGEWVDVIGRRCQLHRHGVPGLTLEHLTELGNRYEIVFGCNEVGTLNVWAVVAQAFVGAGKQADALPILKKALEIQVSEVTPKSLAIRAGLLSIAGINELNHAHFAAAEGYFREAMECGEKAGEACRSTLPIIMQNLGVALRQQSRLDEAETVLMKALEDAVATFGPDHFHPANMLKNLGQVYLKGDRVSEAKAKLEHAVKSFTAADPGVHPVSEKLKEARDLLLSIKGE
jgi:tetratricopeptide (TPR) repeat protein